MLGVFTCQKLKYIVDNHFNEIKSVHIYGYFIYVTKNQSVYPLYT
jgi:hypothetical protein